MTNWHLNQRSYDIIAPAEATGVLCPKQGGFDIR